MHITRKRSLNEREGRNVSLMRERIEMVQMFKEAMISQDWELAGTLIFTAELQIQIQNDFLCKAMEFIWFLKSQHELDEITRLIKMIISAGAGNFTEALIKSSFLAACLSVYGSLTMRLESSPAIMIQRLLEDMEQSNWNEVFIVKPDVSVKNLSEWVMTCIENHSERFEKKGNGHKITFHEVRLQILGFKTFLNIAGSNLSRMDFLEAFTAARWPLMNIQNFYPGWEFEGGAYLILSLLAMLVDGGANNLNQNLLEATQFGSTELVRIFLQLAEQKNLVVDVELALQYASQIGNIRTIECLVVEGKATSFLKPLMYASKKGSMSLIQWFVNRGCQNVQLIVALAIAASNNHVELATYLLHHIPLPFLTSKRNKIIKMTYSLGGCASPQGVSLLFRLNFLGDSVATYAFADEIARSDDDNMPYMLKAFLREQWSEEGFMEGMMEGKNHYVNLMRILKRGESFIWLRDLPPPLLIAIGYMTLYKDCVKANGPLLPQRLRGQLVEVAERITNGAVNRESKSNELLAVLQHQLPLFVRPS